MVFNRTNHEAGHPSCVLIAGKTEIFDHSTLKQLSDYYRIAVVGENNHPEKIPVKISTKVNIYTEKLGGYNFEKIMHSYTPDAVWYFSGWVDGGDGLEDERRKIEEIIRCCQVNDVKKLIVVSSLESLHYKLVKDTDSQQRHKEYRSEAAFDCAQMEEHVNFCAQNRNLKTIILRVPYVYRKHNDDNYLGTLFERLSNKEEVHFQYNENETVDFISLNNLAEMLVSVTEESMDSSGTFDVLSGNELSYKELSDALIRCEASAKVSFEESGFHDIVLNRKNEFERFKKEYGFIPNCNILEDIEEAYKNYHERVHNKKNTLDSIKKIFSYFSRKIVVAGELLILFAIVQMLLRFTSDNVYFKYVDLRLFFVVILASTHGMLVGVLAGVLECVSLFFSYADIGVDGTMLFYNMDYWLPFVTYLITGAVIGYLVTTKNQKIKFAEEEVFNLQNKYLFLNDVYLSVIDNKEEYKRQILGYHDSFGKVFDAVERLDSSNTADIFMNGVEILEHILDNQSIAIYMMDSNQRFARLVACSREMNSELSKSMDMKKLQKVYDVIVNRETWKNTEFDKELPMYAYAITDRQTVKLFICIYEANSDQLSLYYMNLFTILCHLIRVSFERAIVYQDAIESEKYFKGTQVLIPEYFEEMLESQRKMSDSGVASYALLELNTDNINEESEKLQGLIRQTDVVGVGKDGKNYLLLAQAGKAIFGKIETRLKEHDVDFTLVEGM